MTVRCEQYLMLVLSMQLDQLGGQLAQRSGSGQRAVDERPTTALRGDLAAYHELASGLCFEERLDMCDLFSSANEITRGSTAQEKGDRFDENRLPCSSLAGEHGEARSELDLNLFDDGGTEAWRQESSIAATVIVA
jgi:hypothetical protein